MRKKGPSRQLHSKLLRPEQVTSLLISPQMGFRLLCAGTANIAHVQSILGLFNLVAALIPDTRHAELRPHLLAAQNALACLEPQEGEGLLLPLEQQPIVSGVLQYADRLLRMTDQGRLARAVIYVNRSFKGQTKATIVPWNSLTPP